VEGDSRPATRICLAAFKQDLCLIDFDNPTQHRLQDYKPAVASDRSKAKLNEKGFKTDKPGV
jgi:hypothetical protein